MPIIGLYAQLNCSDLAASTRWFTALFEQAGVKEVVYGHLHGAEAFKNGLQGSLNGVSYHLVSLDYLKFKPMLVFKGGN